MKDIVEIRWHGRGGQGAKTAALLLADVNQNGLRNAQDVQRLYEQLTGTA